MKLTIGTIFGFFILSCILAYFYHLSARPPPKDSGLVDVLQSLSNAFSDDNGGRSFSAGVDLMIRTLNSIFTGNNMHPCIGVCTSAADFYFNIPGPPGCMGEPGHDGAPRYCKQFDSDISTNAYDYCSCSECICKTRGDIRKCIEQENLKCSDEQILWAVQEGSLTLLDAEKLSGKLPDISEYGDSCCECLSKDRHGSQSGVKMSHFNCFNIGLCPVISIDDESNPHWWLFGKPIAAQLPCTNFQKPLTEYFNSPENNWGDWFKSHFNIATSDNSDYIPLPSYITDTFPRNLRKMYDFNKYEPDLPDVFAYDGAADDGDEEEESGTYVYSGEMDKEMFKKEIAARAICSHCSSDKEKNKGLFMCDSSMDISDDITGILKHGGKTSAPPIASRRHTNFYDCVALNPAGTCSKNYCASIYCPGEPSLCPENWYELLVKDQPLANNPNLEPINSLNDYSFSDQTGDGLAACEECYISHVVSGSLEGTQNLLEGGDSLPRCRADDYSGSYPYLYVQRLIRDSHWGDGSDMYILAENGRPINLGIYGVEHAVIHHLIETHLNKEIMTSLIKKSLQSLHGQPLAGAPLVEYTDADRANVLAFDTAITEAYESMGWSKGQNMFRRSNQGYYIS